MSRRAVLTARLDAAAEAPTVADEKDADRKSGSGAAWLICSLRSSRGRAPCHTISSAGPAGGATAPAVVDPAVGAGVAAGSARCCCCCCCCLGEVLALPPKSGLLRISEDDSREPATTLGSSTRLVALLGRAACWLATAGRAETNMVL